MNRAVPRGAAFSWYPHSPTRVLLPYARRVLVRCKATLPRAGVIRWRRGAEIQSDPRRRRRYQQARGKGWSGGSGWAEATEMIAAAHAHHQGVRPDRVAGFFAADPGDVDGSRMHAASPASDGTDRRGDIAVIWYADCRWPRPRYSAIRPACRIRRLVGRRVPADGAPTSWVTGPRTHTGWPVRYRGTKVVTVSPTTPTTPKSADEWMPCAAGTGCRAGRWRGPRDPVRMFGRSGFRFFVDPAPTPTSRSGEAGSATVRWCRRKEP